MDFGGLQTTFNTKLHQISDKNQMAPFVMYFQKKKRGVLFIRALPAQTSSGSLLLLLSVHTISSLSCGMTSEWRVDPGSFFNRLCGTFICTVFWSSLFFYPVFIENGTVQKKAPPPLSPFPLNPDSFNLFPSLPIPHNRSVFFAADMLRKDSGYASRRQSMNDMQRKTSRTASQSSASRRGSRTASVTKTRRSSSSAPAATSLGVKLSSVAPAKPADKLSAVEKSIVDIDALKPAVQQKVVTLFLSGNLLKSLDGVEQFKNLKTLSAGNNYVATLEGLLALKNLDKLDTVNLQGNAVTQLPYYRSHVLHLCPRLTTLDGKEVTARERANLATTLEAERAMLVELYVRTAFLQRCRHATTKVKMHNEFHSIIVSKGGSRRAPSVMSLEKFLVASTELIVWYQPFEASVAQLRLQVRRARLVKMAATQNDKDIDSHAGWSGAYNEALLNLQAAMTDEVSRLQGNISSSFGINFETLEDTSIMDTVKQLILQLSELNERGELLSEWKGGASGVTSPGGLPPQQADPSTPLEGAAPLSMQQLQEVDDRQQRAHEKHRQRLARRSSASSSDPPPASNASQASAEQRDFHVIKPNPPAPAPRIRVPTPSEAEPSAAASASVSPSLSFGRAPSEMSLGMSRAETALHVSDEVKLQQVNEALRSKLEEYQRSNEKTTHAARHYKGLLQEALHREADLKAELDDVRASHLDQQELISTLRRASAELELQEADSIAALETRHAHEVDASEAQLYAAHAKIAALEKECTGLRTRVTRFRNESRLDADRHSTDSEDIDPELERLLEEAKERLTLRRTFQAMRRAAQRQRNARIAAELCERNTQRGKVRDVFCSWRRQAFVQGGERGRRQDVVMMHFLKWYQVAEQKVLSKERREREKTTHASTSQSRSNSSSSSMPSAAYMSDDAARRLFVKRPARRIPRDDITLRLAAAVRPPAASPPGKADELEQHNTLLPRRRNVPQQAQHTRSSESSEDRGDYMSPQQRRERPERESREERRRRREQSAQAMHCYVQRLQANAFQSWKRSADRANTAALLSRHTSKAKVANERIADTLLKQHNKRIVRSTLLMWTEATSKRIMLRRIEESCVHKLAHMRQQQAFSKWKSAGITMLLRAKSEKTKLTQEVCPRCLAMSKTHSTGQRAEGQGHNVGPLKHAPCGQLV